ncbi:ammonium transporter [Marinospirillum alkaliphilum]|uniref:Diguanylate cyclase/phosphodiesterase with PAS/PAC sensor(S) /ammonium transporter n=1 Tax=Marinospirillum alkaliphilum DSM 21637 TaxID=1122209 RepID=A0A1K1Y149_9GAMM|nr:ammonium transporter [Marinospirillum alkaliphilum]SFX55615.1 diguanylate cyclase/phosphodiesterase with PAS/PAC sensor(s) /ammonium transporter [Marinospirillum alkaliphilum DSM 21637]
MEKEAIDALWLLLAAILVLLMQGGFLCLESGLTRSKNAINVALKNAFDLLVVVVLYWLVGFALMFGNPSGWWPEARWIAADFSQLGWHEAGFFFFQLTFCATAATIVSGAIAERSRFFTYVMLTVLITVLVYPVVGHWAWSSAFNGHEGWLERLGFVDFAGSTVVHSVGGWVALAAVLVIGPRQGRFDAEGRVQEIPGSNLPLAMLGMLFFIFGWLGFNGGSTLAFTAAVPGIIINTLLAGAAGGIVALLVSQRWQEGQRVTPLTINGTLAGLVAVTASAHAVSTPAALLIGVIGSLCMLLAERLLLRWRLDDAISAVPVHLAAGIWGTLAVALFGRAEQLDTGLGWFAQLQVQLLGVLAIGLYSFTLALVFLLVLRRWIPLRVSATGEQEGLNVSEHGARTELNELLMAMARQEKSEDLQQRVPVEPFTEVGQIAAQYNRVMDKLNRMVSRTRLIVRDIRDGVITFTGQGIITSINPGAEHLFGKARHELVGQPTRMLLHQDCQHLYPRIQPDQLFPALAAGASEGPHELVVRRQDGSAFYVEITTAASPTEGGVQYSAVIRDISERKRMEAQLHRHSELAQVTLEAITEGVITCDALFQTIYLNPVAAQLTGWPSRQAYGKPLQQVLSLQGGDQEPLNLESLCQSRRKQCLQLLSSKGARADVEVTPAPLHDHQGHPIGWVLVLQDVTHSNHLQQQLSFQAIHDTLTGLVNRREFEHRLQAMIQDVGQNQSEHILCYMDLDQFKIVNDTCGHRAGDLLLRQLADTLKPLLRQSDTLARLGGDEFGVLLSHCPLQRGQDIAEKLRQVVCDFRFSWEGRVFSVGVSIGLVPLQSPCGDLDEVLTWADTACYAAKNLGRNRVHLYTPDSSEVQQQTQQVQWVNRIQQALDQDLFRLYCQPVLPLNTTEPLLPHYEILLRLQDPQGQVVPPGAFIPSAERFNLMPQIDAWVIRNTLAWMGDQLRSSNRPLLCAINLSGASIGDPHCLQVIREQIERHRVPAHYICFEITETTAMADLMLARDFITELKKLGCRFALDDFGSGLSSFGYLKQLPVDYLKIDGIFIRELADNPIDQAMVASINNIGHIMGLKTIAEFVENAATLEVLQQLDVDFAQGFYLGQPQPLEQLGNVRVMPR